LENDKGALTKISNLALTREAYVEGFQDVSIRNAVAKVNFFTNRPKDDGNGDEKIGVVTLVISLVDLIGIAEGLNNVIKEIEKTGMIKRVETKPESGKD
jgi:hypothetical protein